MAEITLTDEQVKTITEASSPVFLKDRHGKLLGRAVPTDSISQAQRFTAEEIEDAKRVLHSDEPLYSSQEVLDHLKSLEEK